MDDRALVYFYRQLNPDRVHLAMSPIGTKRPMRDVRYSAAIGGIVLQNSAIFLRVALRCAFDHRFLCPFIDGLQHRRWRRLRDATLGKQRALVGDDIVAWQAAAGFAPLR